jgi:hypothetical protein
MRYTVRCAAIGLGGRYSCRALRGRGRPAPSKRPSFRPGIFIGDPREFVFGGKLVPVGSGDAGLDFSGAAIPEAPGNPGPLGSPDHQPIGQFATPTGRGANRAAAARSMGVALS